MRNERSLRDYVKLHLLISKHGLIPEVRRTIKYENAK